VVAPKSLRARQRKRRRFHQRQSARQPIVIYERGRLDGRALAQLVDQRR
jgi:hypothetical protein